MLRIDEEYYIDANENCFRLIRKYKPTQKPPNCKKNKDITTDVVGYYSGVRQALNRYRTEQMKQLIMNEKLDLKTFIEHLTCMDADLMAKLKRFDEMPV